MKLAGRIGRLHSWTVNPPLLAGCLLIGCAILFRLPRLPAMATTIAVLATAALLFLRWRNTGAAVALAIVAGMAWAGIHAHSGLAKPLAAGERRIDVAVEATVSSLVRAMGTTLAFQVVTPLPGNSAEMSRIDVRWYEYPPDTRRPRAGEVWRLNLRLHRPHGSANPGSRFRADYAYRHGIVATGYVRHGDNGYVRTRFWHGLIDRFRARLSGKLHEQLAQYDSAAIVVALAVGDRQYLAAQDWQVLRRTGLSHLVAISGLHIGIVAGLAYRLGALIGAASTLRLRRQYGIVIACLFSAAMAFCYAAMAGFTIPTRRALIVVCIFLAVCLSRRSNRPFYSLSFALLLILTGNPKSVLDSGFWLSFAAVAVLLYHGTGQLIRNGLRDLWQMQFAVLVGLAPLMIILFGQLSVIAPLVNFFLLPVFTLIVVPLVLLGVLVHIVHEGIGLAILQAVARLLDILWTALKHISDIAVMIGPSSAPGTVAIVLAIAGALWLLAPPGVPARGLGVVCLLPALFAPATTPAPGSFEMTVLDVGQGLAVVVQTHRHVLIFDTGPKWRSGTNAAERIVIPYLEHKGIFAIDRLVVSHGDADHAGGLETLRRRYPAMTMLASDVADVDACTGGQRWFWDGVVFEVLHPQAGSTWSGNNASCVLRISNSHNCLLLTGDIEADAEQALVREMRERLACRIVVAPHHGSNTSSTQRFVRAAQAQHVLVSASYRNPWGFPRSEVVDRWERSGAVVLSTSTSGAISALFERQGGVHVHQYRCQHRRFWRPECTDPGQRSD